MSSDSTESFIGRLASDLEPVRQLPRLRFAFAVVLLSWVVVGTGIVASGLRRGLWSDLSTDWMLTTVFAALWLSAVSCTAAALAAAVPGRERAVWVGSAVGVASLGLAALVCLVGLVPGGLAMGAAIAGARMCLSESVLLGLIPVVAIGAFVLRGWVARPWVAASIAVGASAAMGAGVLMLRCNATDAAHLLMGHVAAPLLFAIVLAAPVGVLIRRVAR